MASQSPLEDYITRKELARELGKSVRTLDRWHLRRIGPPRTLAGSSILYNKSKVLAWLETRTEKTVSLGARAHGAA